MADTPIPADVLEPTISPQNPALIIAGIKHFGLASDGSDLRDLAATVSAQEADRAAQAERMARLEEALKPFAECYARYVKRTEEAKAWGNPAPGFSSADRTFSIGALYEAARALSQEGSEPS